MPAGRSCRQCDSLASSCTWVTWAHQTKFHIRSLMELCSDEVARAHLSLQAASVIAQGQLIVNMNSYAPQRDCSCAPLLRFKQAEILFAPSSFKAHSSMHHRMLPHQAVISLRQELQKYGPGQCGQGGCLSIALVSGQRRVCNAFNTSVNITAMRG